MQCGWAAGDVNVVFVSVNIKVPTDLYAKAAKIASDRHISVDEVFASAFAEQLAVWERLKQRAARGDREKFRAVLDKVPDVEPDESDR